jgi:phosphoribosylaminoimidazole synthetase
MCVNDLIVQGAQPIFFLDYIAINKIKLNKVKKILDGIVNGCKISSCALVGGETAEMPGTYERNKFDLAGFAVGAVEKKKLIQSKKIRDNNLILAIPSSGIHSNGFSLIRYLIKKKKINLKKKYISNLTIGEELLKPTRIYVKNILELNKKNLINGCAHITGGGLIENLSRILPKNMHMNIHLNQIKTLNIFKWIKSLGVRDSEMLKVFNCGIGFCIIIDKNKLKNVMKIFPKNIRPYVIGNIIKKSKKNKIYGKINW